MITFRWARTPNWGDALNPIIIEKLSGTRPIYDSKNPNYLCIGSILQWAKDNTKVWGTGIIRSKDIITYKPHFFAVRGPLTRNLLLQQNIDCPDVYGDPALLYSRFYKPKVSKKYKYGIIPHLVDRENPWILKYKTNPDVKIINIERKSSLDDINSFVDEVNECEIILSSSLHGIICADSYNIPSYWIKLSDKVIGNGFKFKDYFSSVGRPLTEPIKPRVVDSIKNFSDNFYTYKINIDLDKLLKSCPFKNIK